MGNELKVGDFVKVIHVTQADIFLGVQLGGVYTVSHIDEDRDIYIKTSTRATLWLSPAQYVKVQPSPQKFEGFKVGDTVECTSGVPHNGMRMGMRSVVTLVHNYYGENDGWVQLADYPGLHAFSRIKGVARDEPAPAPKLNDGARLPSSLPNDSATRKEYPLAEVLFGQFPAACVAVAHHSYKGNQKHNPGKPLQDNRSLSNDDASCIMRHLMEGDYEGVAWRAMRLLQKKLEAEGAPIAPLAAFE